LRTESLANRPAATASHPIVRVGADRLVAYQLEFDAGDLLALARAATTVPQVGWVDLAAGRTWVGFGVADEVLAYSAEEALAAPDRCRDRLASVCLEGVEQGALRYFGGIAFDPESTPHPLWKAGLPARFVLPEVTLRQDAGQTRATATLVLSLLPGEPIDTWQAHVDALLERLERWKEAAEGARPCPFSAHRIPGLVHRDRWSQQIRTALANLDRHEKVVLAREIWLEQAGLPDPWSLIERFPAAVRGHRFCFRFDAATAFVGATPERLVSVEGDRLHADCLAGTTARGRDAAEDDLLASDLLANDKERREHAFVVEAVKEALGPFCRSTTCPDEPSVLRLPNLQHLHTPFEGELSGSASLGAILAALHPTPAVCGVPKAKALATIRDLEPNPRGWYAGAVGWIGSEAAEFAVGIRSAILHPMGAIAFTGAGVVAGSDPDAEYEETERKAAPLLAILEGRSP
jgi:isochorismate synthase